MKGGRPGLPVPEVAMSVWTLSCVKVEVAVLGPELVIVRRVCVDVKLCES